MRVGGAFLCGFVALALGAADARAAVFTVNETTDAADSTLGDDLCDSNATAGLQCSLRAAIEEANTDPDADAIHFAIPGNGPHRIEPNSALPGITQQLTIDGYTQPGSAPNTNEFGKRINADIMIELRGSGLSFSGGAAASEVRGLAIGNVSGAVAIFTLVSSLKVQGCFLGTDASGTKARPTNAGFVGSQALIGGPDPEDRNLASGNLLTGIGSNFQGIMIGNYIGTEADGRSPLPNGENGIFDGGGALIEQNLIAFNKDDGIVVPNLGNGLITRNLIYRNGENAIDLGDNGPTPNDPGDADTGPNGYQNHPVIKSAKAGPNETTILRVKLQSTPNTEFDLEYFESKRKKSDAQKFLGAGQGLFTDASGLYKQKITLFQRARRVTATATDVAAGDIGATSELSKSVRVR